MYVSTYLPKYNKQNNIHVFDVLSSLTKVRSITLSNIKATKYLLDNLKRNISWYSPLILYKEKGWNTIGLFWTEVVIIFVPNFCLITLLLMREFFFVITFHWTNYEKQRKNKNIYFIISHFLVHCWRWTFRSFPFLWYNVICLKFS